VQRHRDAVFGFLEHLMPIALDVTGRSAAA
jgi:hypothetical protein